MPRAPSVIQAKVPPAPPLELTKKLQELQKKKTAAPKQPQLSARQVFDQIALDPDAGEVLHGSAADKSAGESRVGIGQKIKKGAVKGYLGAKKTYGDLKEKGEGSVAKGLYRGGKEKASAGLATLKEKAKPYTDKIASGYRSVRDRFKGDPNDKRSFKQKMKEKGGGGFFRGLGRTISGGVKSAGRAIAGGARSAKKAVKEKGGGSFWKGAGRYALAGAKAAGKGAVKLGTGKSTEEIQQEWGENQGALGKARVVAKTGGRLLNRLSFGSLGKVAKGVYKAGRGVAGLVGGYDAKRTADRSDDDVSKTFGGALAKSQMKESGFNVAEGALDLASVPAKKALEAHGVPSPLASAGVKGLDMGFGLVKKGVVGEGAGTSLDYLSRGQQSHQSELERSMGFLNKQEARRREIASDREADPHASFAHDLAAQSEKQKAQQRREDVQEGRSVLRPSEVKAQARAERARLHAKKNLEKNDLLKKLKGNQYTISD